MLGALYRICDFLDPDSMRDVIRKTFEKKYPHLVEPNIRTFDRGYNEVQFKTYEVPEGAEGKSLHPSTSTAWLHDTRNRWSHDCSSK